MTLTEPVPPNPGWPRYSGIPFPPYRFVPGLNPHPNVDPQGHGRSRPRQREEQPAPRGEPAPPWRPEEWRTLTPYLYGVDLYNYAYWWESHEVLEGLWHAAGRKGVPADFMQGIIHVSAANLNRHRGKREGARRQAVKALARLEQVQGSGPVYMGLDVPAFMREMRESTLEGSPVGPPMIRLAL